MIFHIPHSSTNIPPDLRSAFLLDDLSLADEVRLMTDSFTDDLFGHHATDDDTLITFPVSRLVVDPERFLDDMQEMMAWIGMGVFYTHTSQGDSLRDAPALEERDALIQRFYVPHHKLLNEAAERELDRFGAALVIDCHSFPSAPLPYEFEQDKVRPDICIGTDVFHTPEWLTIAALRAVEDEGLTCKINFPFSGSLVPNHYWQKDKRVSSIMIEVNRSLYMDESTGESSIMYGWCRASVGRILERIKWITASSQYCGGTMSV